MRVAVFSTDKRRFLGLGSVEEVETVYVAGSKLDYPKVIKLDNGMKREGATCWWFPLTEGQEVRLRKMRAR